MLPAKLQLSLVNADIMLKLNAQKIHKSYICIRQSAKRNFCTERNLKSKNVRVVTSNVKNFYQDKNVLVTGATGFMGKCLVEKLLRSCPGIKNVYVLVRSKTGINSEQRIAELTKSQVFDRLKHEQPNAIKKLLGLNGNIELPGLGLNDKDFNKLIENEPVVFHSAANISLQSFEINNFRRIAKTNLGGTKNVLDLCHKMPNCKNLVFLSSVITSFDLLPYEVKDRVYPTKHSPEEVLKALENDKDLTAIIERVKNVFPSTYAYTKRLAENLVLNQRKGLTVAIVRPSGVGAAWREPVRGWVDTVTSINAMAMLMGKGVIRVWRCIPSEPIDIVPVDTANNCVISSAWYTSEYKPNTVSVFSFSSNNINKISRSEFTEMVIESTKKNPFSEIFMYPNVTLTPRRISYEIRSIFVHLMPALVADILLRITGKKPMLMKAQKDISAVYRPMVNIRFNFESRTIFEMWDALSEEDKQEFCFDLRQISWPAYIEDIILGLKQYCFKETTAELPAYKNNLQRKYKIYKILQMTAITTVICSSIGSIYFLF